MLGPKLAIPWCTAASGICSRTLRRTARAEARSPIGAGARGTRGGRPVALMRMAGHIHGFINLTDISPVCREATVTVAKTFKKFLASNSGQKASA